MSNNSLLVLLAVGTFAVSLALPQKSTADAASDAVLAAQIVADLQKQQVTLTENQKKIDDKISVIAEELRLARAFSGRGK